VGQLTVVFTRQIGRSGFIRQGMLLPVRVGKHGTTTAQVDTGSTVSSVDRNLLAKLGYKPTGKMQVYGVNGTMQLPVYPVGLATADGYVLTPGPVLGDDLPAPVQALVGRDVLANLHLSVNGPLGAWAITASKVPVVEQAVSGWTWPVGVAAVTALTAAIAGNLR
jgi:hypothetical protein